MIYLLEGKFDRSTSQKHRTILVVRGAVVVLCFPFSAMNTSIKVTPINGGSVGSGGMCSLLELGTTSRVLLDCGISLSTLAQQVDIMDENARRRSTEYIEQMLKKLEEIKFGDNTGRYKEHIFNHSELCTNHYLASHVPITQI